MPLEISSPEVHYYLADHNERMKLVRSLLPVELSGKLLDIGCWEGNLRKLLLEGVEYYGIDWYTPAQRFPNYLQHDLNSECLPYESNFFDYVVFTEVIEHLINPEDFLPEIKRVLKPKGTLIVSFPNNGTLGERIKYLLSGPKEWIDYGHLHAYTPRTARELIRKYFKITSEKGYAPLIGGLLPARLKNIFAFKRLLQFLAELSPSLFAGNYFFVCRNSETR